MTTEVTGVNRSSHNPAGRPRTFTPDRYREACFAYAQTNSRVKAANAVGVSLSTINRRLADDDEFREMMAHAKAEYVQTLEAEAYRRGHTGVTQKKLGPGGHFYEVTTHSDVLLLHMLKKADPARHGDKAVVEHTHQHEGKIGLEQLSPQNRERLRLVLEEGLDAATA